MRLAINFIVLLFMLVACHTSSSLSNIYESKELHIYPITDSTFVHVSYLETSSFGKVACNGMIYIHNGEAIIFDTPTLDTVGLELINYVEQELKAKIVAVVVNHFHVDCLGGLNAFHQQGIKSYAHSKTKILAKEKGNIIPQIGFDKDLQLSVGGTFVQNVYFGAGHTADNIVSYIDSEKVLFGGCLIKAMGAGKGNLADANVDEWANTVRQVKKAYPNVKHVIPGHGAGGGGELLDFTIDLFE